MLKRKYNQLNTKFKDLKESKVAELDAINQRLDSIQKPFIYLNNKYDQFDTEFKDLKESKVAELDAIN